MRHHHYQQYDYGPVSPRIERRTPLDISRIRHGFPNKPRCQQPSMYEIFAWNDYVQSIAAQSEQERLKLEGEYFGGCEDSLDKENINYANVQKAKNLKSPNKPEHKVHHSLYIYAGDQEKARKAQLQQQQFLKRQKQSQQLRLKYLNKRKQFSAPNQSQSPAQLSSRQKKISQFSQLTRELPDSAFRTYYGKPAFSAAYGIGNDTKSMEKKTFNIMPHAGKNHPQKIQTYQTALTKSKSISECHLPKRPIQFWEGNTNRKGDIQQPESISSEYYNVHIKKPDLINNVRFSEKRYPDSTTCIRKAYTPTHNDLNRLPSRPDRKKNLYKPIPPYKTSYIKGNAKMKKSKSVSQFPLRQQYPTISKRQHLQELLQQKRREQNKLAYKVTQCHPLEFDCQQQVCQKRLNGWAGSQAAGVRSPKSDHVSDIFGSGF